MLQRLRWVDEEAGHALRTLVGRGRMLEEGVFLSEESGFWRMDKAEFSRLINLPLPTEHDPTGYPITEIPGADNELKWVKALLKHKEALQSQIAKAVRCLYLHHAHFHWGDNEGGDASMRLNGMWWKSRLRRAVIQHLGLIRDELSPLLDSHYNDAHSLYDACQPAPWAYQPRISHADQMLFRLELVFNRPLRSDADWAKRLVDYKSSAPSLPAGTTFEAHVAKRFNISELEVSELLLLLPHLLHAAANSAAQNLSTPTSHAWELLARFQRVCILNHPPSVMETACEIAVALMESGLHLTEKVIFVTFLSERFNCTRESTATYLTRVLAEHKRLTDAVPKLPPGALPRWAVATNPGVLPYLSTDSLDLRSYLFQVIFHLDWTTPKDALEVLNRTPLDKRTDPEVLELSFKVHAALKDWPSAWELAQHLLRVQPENVMNWVYASQALRHLREGSLWQAYSLLLTAVRKPKHCPQTVVRFNLARYACELGDLNLAAWWMDTVILFEPGDAWKLKALGDPDFEPLWQVIESTLSEAARPFRRD